MIKLIATDLDGTLINDHGKIDEKMFGLIEYLNEKNIIFAAASGRFYSQLSKNFQRINSDILFISHNGALIKHHKSGKVLYSNCISQKDIKNVVGFKRELGEELFLASDDIAYTVNPSENMLAIFNHAAVPAAVVKSFDEVKCPIHKMTYYVKDGIKPAMLEYLKDNLNDNLEFVLSGDNWIDIANKGVSKGKAIKILQDKFDISEKNTMVFGDYYNDLTMFKTAHYSYAMENAPEDVKKYANFIAESNNNNGVYKVIHKYAVSL